MILHLISDDKFSDYAINQFTAMDNSSEFVVLTEVRDLKLNYIKNKQAVTVINVNSTDYIQFCKTINKYNAVILHGLFSPFQVDVFSLLSEKVKVAWVFWGGEIYGRNDIKLKFLSFRSKIIYYTRKSKKLLKGTLLQQEHYFADKSIYKRINYCLTDVHEDYEFVKKYTHSTMKELWYNYYSIEETVGVLTNQRVNSGNILVGNSCNLENNYQDAFRALSRFNLSDRKIIVPLSYGQTWLKRIIMRKGYSQFTDSFLPLTDFLERDSYNNYMLSCSIVVMNHYRPQAMGNIITALWLGAKVYMSRRSLLFTYFQRIDVYVFSVEDDLKPENKEALLPLESNKVERNRTILKNIYGKENMMPRIKAIVEELNRTE